MLRVIAIDPGPEQSAILCWDGKQVISRRMTDNNSMVSQLCTAELPLYNQLVIEMVACYGMPVGAEVFETCVWIGRFMQAYGPERCHLVKRIEVKAHLCHSARAKDANIRQALIDRFGKPGTKNNPGPLYGVSSHLWAALAVAVTWWDQHQ